MAYIWKRRVYVKDFSCKVKSISLNLKTSVRLVKQISHNNIAFTRSSYYLIMSLEVGS